MELTEQQWRKRLSSLAYHILREKGTEPPFSGKYYDCEKEGIYCCAGCGQEVFSSHDKYHSGSGWPSYTRPFKGDNIGYAEDDKLEYTRKEVYCKKCHGHLGHVFEDGPAPTYQRYCINSEALRLKESS